MLGKHSPAWECGLCSALSWCGGGGDSAALHPQLCLASQCPAQGFQAACWVSQGPLAVSQDSQDAELPQGSPEGDDLLRCLLRVESMSLADRGNPGNITSRLVEKEKARDCLIPMG